MMIICGLTNASEKCFLTSYFSQEKVVMERLL